jgi:glycosyltransferase involved in cell wall biosynthesis
MSIDQPSHVVLIPSYNTGARLFKTIADARQLGRPIIVVVDGSTDGTGEELRREAMRDAMLLVLVLPRNLGKGAAILFGLRFAREKGFTHALTMDADGQHSVRHSCGMISASVAHPDAMILGCPSFDSSAPRIRVIGHKIANSCTALLTTRGAIADSLFGLRIYPIEPLIQVFESTSSMRRFDFDSEAVIRLFWRGLRPINVVTPVLYFSRGEGGVSHFRYLRDNLLLTGMYIRLLAVHLARRANQRLPLHSRLRGTRGNDNGRASAQNGRRATPHDKIVNSTS